MHGGQNKRRQRPTMYSIQSTVDKAALLGQLHGLLGAIDVNKRVRVVPNDYVEVLSVNGGQCLCTEHIIGRGYLA